LEPDHLDAFPQADTNVCGIFIESKCLGHRSIFALWVVDARIVCCRYSAIVEDVEGDFGDVVRVSEPVCVCLGDKYTFIASDISELRSAKIIPWEAVAVIEMAEMPELYST